LSTPKVRGDDDIPKGTLQAPSRGCEREHNTLYWYWATEGGVPRKLLGKWVVVDDFGQMRCEHGNQRFRYVV
jgi:hypothetical protein